MIREDGINTVMVRHNLPRNIAEQVVDDGGNIDNDKLDIALAGAAWGKSPVSSAAPGLLNALERAYWEAADRKDAAGMIILKDRIHQLGGTLGPRKV